MNKEQAEFQRLWNKIGSSGIMILSTCADNRVTSRAMSVSTENILPGNLFRQNLQIQEDYYFK